MFEKMIELNTSDILAIILLIAYLMEANSSRKYRKMLKETLEEASEQITKEFVDRWK